MIDDACRTLGPLVLLTMMTFPAAAQSPTTGELQGVVRDSDGALVSAAGVSVSDDSVGLVRTTVTDALGQYRVLLLPPGDYSIRFEAEGFGERAFSGIRVTVGQIATFNASLEVGAVAEAIEVSGAPALVEAERSQLANTLQLEPIANLPIDRRDYLTFAQLAPGVVDTEALADNADFRTKQTPSTGLSFAGSNGRRNSVTMDGGEMINASGGVRSTISQEGVQEFQINRSNYRAELGSASGGAINIITKSGTNDLNGSLFGFFRHQSFDAADPFARVLQAGDLTRVKPPADRQQYGGSIGLPIVRNRTFLFATVERLHRDESAVVSLLTDESIFEPTTEQEAFLGMLPGDVAAGLRPVFTSSEATRRLFRSNSGVFDFLTRSWQTSVRLDHHLEGGDQLMLRLGYSTMHETNANVEALVGASRGSDVRQADPTVTGSWTHVFQPNLLSELTLQWAYRDFEVDSVEKLGPEIRINGFGVFNRDLYLPSYTMERRYQVKDSVSYLRGAHNIKLGGEALVRGVNSESHVTFPGRFTFGGLPASLLGPALPGSLTINALQAYNLGLAQTYSQGFGDPTVTGNNPFYAVYLQDSWKARPNLTLDLGVRYEYDRRKEPLPTDTNNIAPRFGFAWSPFSDSRTAVRGGYGIFVAPTYFQIDWVVTAFNQFDGRRQIAQVFTSILNPGPEAAHNVFRTLTAQGVIGQRPILAADLEQFGIQVVNSGPLPPFTALFESAEDYVNPYSQQASLGIEHELAPDLALSIDYTFSRTLKLPRSRDKNLLSAAIDPNLGIRVWTDADFVDPFLAQFNTYESTARSWYSGMTVELTRRLRNRFMFSVNYTYSRAIDDVVDFGADFQANDQTDMFAEKALSSFDQRHKFVGYGTWDGPGGFQFSPIVRANSGRPFNLLVGADLNGDRHNNSDRPPLAGRNTGIGPDFWSFDMRVARTVGVGDDASVEFMAEAFNMFNRLNYASVNNTVGLMPGPFNVEGRSDRSPSEPLGFASAREPRRLQLGVRLRF